MIRLGQKARDIVTGFEGIITACTQHLTGCDAYGITPAAKDGKIEDTRWFDENRIEVIGEGVTIRTETVESAPRRMVGGPQDTPRAARNNPPSN